MKVQAVAMEQLKDFPGVRDFSLRKDGNEAYFTAQSLLSDFSVIMRMNRMDGEWQSPKIASFSGRHEDMEAFLSSDGLRLYFASKRPNSFTEKANFDIWFVHRSSWQESWSEPQNLGKAINTAANEFYPSVAHNKNLYFTANQEDSKGGDDIYFSAFVNGQYQKALSLGSNINSKGEEYNAFVDPKETFLLYTAFARPGGFGSGDMYISYKLNDGNWSHSQILPQPINDRFNDYCPFYLGGTLYFTSRRSDIPKPPSGHSDTKTLLRSFNQENNGSSRVYKTEFTLPSLKSRPVPEFLAGKWRIKGTKRVEEWLLNENKELEGKVYKYDKGVKTVLETLKIQILNDSMIYSAKVEDQNDGKTIPFELNQSLGNLYRFENPNHDFPNSISYQKINHNEIQVEVLGNGGKGFQQNLLRYVEPKSIPKWFLDSLSQSVGRWIADNSSYMSQSEKIEEYVMEWDWGMGKTSITGRLYGIRDGKTTNDFWHFRQYWNNAENKGWLIQFGRNGVIGEGEVRPLENGEIEIVQNFSNPSQQSWKSRHTSSIKDNIHENSSFKEQADGVWKLDRHYTWKKKL